MLSLNQEIIVEIIDLGYQGEGIAKHDGFVVFINNALPGETILVKITKINKKFAYGQVINIIKESSNRITPPCKYFYECGGCNLQHLNYFVAFKHKTDFVLNAFKKIAKTDVKITSAYPCDKQYGYRNKIALVATENNGVAMLGLHTKNGHDKLVIDKCLITDNETEKYINIINAFFKENNLQAYNYKLNTGLIRHVVIRSIENKTLIALVINGSKLPKIESLLDKLKIYQENVGVYINENVKQTKEIFGEKFKHVFGLNKIKLTMLGLNFEIGIESFLQVNLEIQDKLYKNVLNEINKNDTVINCYSGAGLLTAILAKKSKNCIGIELNKEATAAANKLIKLNNIDNVVNICGKVENNLNKVLQSIVTNTTLIIDPPRNGLDINVALTLAKTNANKIIYISCDENTLARDIKTITENSKFKIKSVDCYDMFPQTKNLETVVILEK